MTNKLTTAQLAEELGMSRTAFVKHRPRYEQKLIAAGFDFIKEGIRQNITYTFSTNEPLSIENVGDKIRRIFKVETKGKNKTFDKYLRFIASEGEIFSSLTDLEVATAIQEHRTTVTEVRGILTEAGYFSPLEEARYYKEVAEDEWEEVDREEWASVWKDIYYPEYERLKNNPARIMVGEEMKELNPHFLALNKIKEETGFRYKRIYTRVYNFDFLGRLNEYIGNSPNSLRQSIGMEGSSSNSFGL